MAYQFPTEDLVDGQIVFVPQKDGTKIPYQWFNPPGVWKALSTGGDGTGTVTTADVLTINARPTSVSNPFDADADDIQTQQNANWYLWDNLADIHFGADKPDDEHYEFWFDTDRLELLISHNEQWFPVSIPAEQLQAVSEIIEGLEVSVTQVRGDIAKNKIDIDELRQDIIDGEFRPDLQQVLDQGNVANKNLFLTNGADDLIDLSVTEKRIVMAATGTEAIPKFELRLVNGNDQSNAAFEIDEGGTRLDFEAEGKIDNMHFRFGNVDKLILNKSGDAEFKGKVQAEPGTQNNELVTYGQLLTVEEELEQLAPSLDRGTWEFTLDSEPGVGKYTLVKEKLDADAQNAICSNEYLQCIADAGGNAAAQAECSRQQADCTNAVVPLKIVTTNDFSEAVEVIFNTTDYNGVEHTFAGIDPDHLLDLFNESDDSYLVGDITSDSGGVFKINVMSARGNAVGIASLKIFKHEGSVDFDQYVRKQGDTMSGKLVIERPRTSDNDNSFIIRGRVDGAETVLLKDYQRESNSSRSDFIEYFGESISPNCLVNVQYVKDYIEEQFNQIPGSDIADPPKYFKWSLDNNADVSPGYFTGPPSRNNDEPRLNAQSTVWISMPDYFGKAFQASTNPRTFGWGTTITVSEKLNSNTSRLCWSAQVKSISMAPNTQLWEVTFTNLVLINWMSTSPLYRVEIGGVN